MGLLQTLGTGQGYLKAGFLGFPKSGKTYTASKLAVGTHKFFGNCGDVVFFDTEGGAEYVAPMIADGIGKPPLGVRSRSFADLMAVTREVKDNDIVIVDSVTHVYREVCDSHLEAVNKMLARRNRPRRTKLEFQDWGPIKSTWAQFTDWYLNSRVHVIICGRAGYEYDFDVTEDDSGREKKELIKTGTKMKVESEFGFEPSLLVEMFRDDTEFQNGKKVRVSRRYALVRGDRFAVIDGQKFVEPTFESFLPHIQRLKPGAHAPVDTALKTDTGVGEDGDAEWTRERRAREIAAEEIKACFIKADMDGNSGEAKKARVGHLEVCFGTSAWSKVETMNSDTLRAGLQTLRERLGQVEPAQEQV